MNNKTNVIELGKPFAVAITLFACLALTACSLFGAAKATPPPAPVPEPTQAPVAGTPAPTPTATPAPTFRIATDRHDAIYNSESFGSVHLSMAKAELEEQFAPGPITDNGYTSYDDYDFFIKYYGNDTVKEIVVYGSEYGSGHWATFNGIACGSSYADIVSEYGEPLSSNGNAHSYYSLNNVLLREMPSFANIDINYLYTISFIVENDSVACIMISKL